MNQKIAIFGLSPFSIELAKKFLYQNVLFITNKPITQLAFNHILVDEFEKTSNKLQFDAIFACEENEEDNLFFLLGLNKAIAKNIIAFGTHLNEKKLYLAGATKVIDKNKAISSKIFDLLVYPTIDKFLEYTYQSNLAIEQIVVTEKFKYINSKLSNIDFEKIFGLVIIGMIDFEYDEGLLYVYNALNRIVTKDDILVVMGKEENIENLKKGML